jgi:hypothetical protein
MSCIICRNEAAKTQLQEADLTSVECPRCGTFFVSGTLEALWQPAQKTPQQNANASGWIREHPRVRLGSDDLSMLETLVAPSVAERAQRLLQYLATSFPALNAHFIVPNPVTNPSFCSITYSSDTEVGFLFHQYLLDELGYVRPIGSNNQFYMISPKGHAYLEELRTANADSQIGFCAMWFNLQTSDLWSKGIEPGTRSAGYEPFRIDKHNHVNRIDDEIMASIRRSKFCVADFTHGDGGVRGGVYFEAGFALGLGLQVIWTCRKDFIKEQKIHFDVRQYNFLEWESGDLGDFSDRLKNRIESIFGHGSYQIGSTK